MASAGCATPWWQAEMAGTSSPTAEIVAGDHVRPAVTLRVVSLCALAILAEGYDVGIMGATLIALRNEPGWTSDPVALGFLSSASLFGMLLGAALIGSFSSRFGLRGPTAACVAGFSAASICCALAPTPLFLAGFRFLGGIAMGGIVPLAAAYTVEYSPERDRLRNYGLMYSGYSFGIMAVALLAILMVPLAGWRSLFWLGGVPLLLVPVLLSRLPESLQFLASRGRMADAERVAAELDIEPALVGKMARPATETLRPIDAVRVLFARAHLRATVFFWLSLGLGLMLAYAAGTWLPSIMRDRGFPVGSSLGVLVTFSLASAFGGIIAGYLADRFGPRRVIAFAFATGALAFTGLARVESQVIASILAGLAGFGSVSAALTLTGFTTGWYPPEVRATAIGWALSFARIGAIAGPIVIGAIVALSGNDPGRSLLAMGAISLVPAVLVLLIPQRRV